MKNIWQILGHILFWVLLVLFFLYIANVENAGNKFPKGFLLFPALNICLFYFNYFILLPHYFKEKLYVKYCAVLVATVVIVGLIKYGLATLLGNIPHIYLSTFISYFLGTILTSIQFAFLSVALKFANDWFLKQRQDSILYDLNLHSKMSLIESQTNAHFLFNSLNSLYALAYKYRPSAPAAILSLTAVMHYITYKSNEKEIDLKIELDYLRKYVELQKLRFGENTHIEFTVTGETGNLQIAPMLLIPFVENAIKHGVLNEPLFPIIIDISINKNKLKFYTENKIHKNNLDSSSGIKIHQVEKRLEFLYSANYSLNINDGEERYSCKLCLELNKT